MAPKVHRDLTFFGWYYAEKTLENVDRYSDGPARIYSSTFVLQDKCDERRGWRVVQEILNTNDDCMN